MIDVNLVLNGLLGAIDVEAGAAAPGANTRTCVDHCHAHGVFVRALGDT
ncbi:MULTISPECIES: hypothetical protein [Bradyrhizobium]|uniref:Uncharacterized protein n=1 Tax=Bradyrhizobium brasilense TaxID=1419277 RepID=A0ABY8JF18_9BRAD|nr:hypothetical protein [Bradyrhizobium brasilense]MCP3419270.1 hypothetical protein [Bradyrhizobium brasilense]WFU62382.1 hypothetical protein QA636_33540 [Bradyrhizobium brasilense]